MRLKIKLIFNRGNSLNPDGKGLVTIQVMFPGGVRKHHSTNVYVKPSEWNGGQVSPLNKDYMRLNHYLNKMVDKIDGYDKDCYIEERVLSWEDLKAVLNGGSTTSASVPSFNEFYRTKLDTDNTLSGSTKVIHERTLAIVNDFNSSIKFAEINPSFITKFTNYLSGLKLSHNTQAKHHNALRRYINIAIDEPSIPFKDYPYNRRNNIRFVRTKFDFLRPEEVKRFAEVDAPYGTNLWLVKIRFLLACRTGLRWSDINRLKKDYLRFYDDGIAIDMGRMQKVDRQVFIPLYKYFDGTAQEYLEEYGGAEYKFRTFSDDNKYLKILGKEADLNRDISFHLARHTFCTLLYHETKDLFLVMKLAGISKVETAMTYVHAAEMI